MKYLLILAMLPLGYGVFTVVHKSDAEKAEAHEQVCRTLHIQIVAQPTDDLVQQYNAENCKDMF